MKEVAHNLVCPGPGFIFRDNMVGAQPSHYPMGTTLVAVP